MSKTKKPRKAYRPTHEPNPQAFMVAIRGAHLLCAHDQLTRAARVRSSVEMLAASTGGMPQWRDVFDALNMIEAFAHAGLVRNAREFVAEHQASIVAAMDRHRSTGSNVLRPVEVQMMRDLAATWAEVLSIVTCREYFEAEERVKRKVRQALSKGSHGSVRVVEAA